MKRYFEKLEDGRLVLVAEPVEGQKYFLEDGTEVTYAKEPTPAPAIRIPEADPIGELTGLMRDIASAQSKSSNVMNDIKEKVDLNEAAIRTFQEQAAKGFPIPGQGAAAPNGSEEDMSVYAPYDLAKQGKGLVNRFGGGYSITEEKRVEMAKYFVLFLKAGLGQDPAARQLLRERYAPVGKTDIGDSGNVFPVPDIVDSEIFAFAREQSALLQYARLWEMTSEKMSFPSETAQSTPTWGNTTPNSDPTIAEVELTAEELSAYTTVKNMTLADARSDIVTWLTQMMAEAAALELDNSGFNGDGTSTYGSCSGVLSAAAGYSVVMASGSTNFSAITADHLSEMISKLDGLKKVGARFFMHGSILHYVRGLKDTNDRPIFLETVGAPMSGQIWGYPYTEVIKAVSTSAVSTGFVVFGNLRYFAVGRRLDATALQVDPYGDWTTNRTRFKLYQRWGIDIALANGFARLVTAAS